MINWSPDWRWLAASAFFEIERRQPRRIYLIPVQGGEPRPLLSSKTPADEADPAFSPDGHWLAYASCSGASTTGFRGGCHVYVIELDAAVTPTGPPRRLTTQGALHVGGITWTRDGKSVVYVVYVSEAAAASLWRVGVEGTRPPERIEVAGFGAVSAATAPSRDRLAFARMTADSDIYRFEADRPARWVVGSTSLGEDVRLSADGRRLAFASTRSGDTSEIWVAAADGSGVQQLTHGPGSIQGSPSWSPDGRRIAFDSFTDHWHVWVIDADGGTPHRLTTEPGDQNVPTWSRDGRWIYFSANQGTRRDIWRLPSSGGPAERMTRGVSGQFACESPDGRSLLFQPKDADSPLLAIPLTGGEARQLVACVSQSAFGTGPRGVYYVPCDPTPDPVVHVLDPETGRDRPLGKLEKFVGRPLGLAVSPDGTIFYSRNASHSADLMLIENFR